MQKLRCTGSMQLDAGVWEDYWRLYNSTKKKTGGFKFQLDVGLTGVEESPAASLPSAFM